MDDTISRQDAYDTLTDYYHHTTQTQHNALRDALSRVPSVPEPEITDEQAILHLQSTGWMQNHDREMYESGVREQLADDSGSYDSLIPCTDTISRQAAINALENCEPGEELFMIKSLPSAQPHWILCSERLPIVENDIKARVLVTTSWGLVKEACYRVDYWDIDDIPYKLTAVVAWMPLPEPYVGEGEQDG